MPLGAGSVGWSEHCPCAERVVGSSLGQVAGLTSGWGVYRGQPIDVPSSLNISLSLLSCLSKIKRNIPERGFEKEEVAMWVFRSGQQVRGVGMKS